MISILDPRFVYTSSARTDITKRFKAVGWVPPKEKYNPDCLKLENLARDIAYGKRYENLPQNLREAALSALEPSAELNQFSHEV